MKTFSGDVPAQSTKRMHLGLWCQGLNLPPQSCLQDRKFYKTIPRSLWDLFPLEIDLSRSVLFISVVSQRWGIYQCFETQGWIVEQSIFFPETLSGLWKLLGRFLLKATQMSLVKKLQWKRLWSQLSSEPWANCHIPIKPETGLQMNPFEWVSGL